MSSSISNSAMAALLLRVGLAAIFMYAAIASLLHPLEWTGFIPTFLKDKLSAVTLIKVISIYELGLVIWLVIGKKIKYAALLASATLLGILVLNTHQLIITFRDFGLAMMALALYYLEK